MTPQTPRVGGEVVTLDLREPTEAELDALLELLAQLLHEEEADAAAG